MTAPVFVDTNVFLYARDSGETVKQPRAIAWLEFLWRERLGRTSVQVLSEYYVNVTRKLDPGLPDADAWDDVLSLFTWRPQHTDEPLLHLAREIVKRHRLSWWDALVVAAAQMQGCALLLTEDLQDGGDYNGVTVRSPFTLALAEAAATYVAAPASVPRHPSRGRPARKQGPSTSR